MRAISLWQPWASAIALGLKRIETRHWPTDYRGPLAIHAAKRWSREQREFAAVEKTLGRLPARVPLGAIVAICRLTKCVRTEELLAAREAFGLTAIERIYGNYEPERFGWLLEDVQALPEPIGFSGAQGFFNVPDDILPADLRAVQPQTFSLIP
jgi:hypothetical protein